jgi:hypothetical protein
VAWEHLGKALLSLVDKYKRALQVGAQQRKGSILVTVRIDALCHKAFCQRVSAYEMVGAMMVEDLGGCRLSPAVFQTFRLAEERNTKHDLRIAIQLITV